MPKSTGTALDLDVDLQSGVVPISRAASSLAALIKRGKERQQPIIVTQKGYPTGVLLPIDLYSTLRDLAQRDVNVGTAGAAPASLVEALPPDASHATNGAGELPDRAEAGEPAAPASDHDEPAEAPAPPRRRGGRRPKAAQ